MIKLDLPIPPSTNNLYFNAGRGGGRRVTPEYTRWRWGAYVALKEHDFRSFEGAILGPYKLTILLPQNFRGDCSNRIKSAEDFLVEQRVTPDDRHCVKVSAERSADVASGRCHIIVEAAP